MAIYHFSGQVMGRSSGRSVVAAAAYRAAEKLYDERTDLIHDFEKKADDILYKEIMLPVDVIDKIKAVSNAKGTEESKELKDILSLDRQKLWNAVERAENRKDAQLAREFNIALPKELTDEQNIALIREYVQEQFTSKGMIADLCLHRGHKDTEEKPHAHIMLTMREVTADGFGKKVRDWNDRALLNSWREEWANVANKHLALHGYDMRIDHRTLEAQGINLEPQSKIGPKQAYKQLARYEEHQQIAKENGERIYKNPEIALRAVTQQQSTFTHNDLARFVNSNTIDREQFDKVHLRVKGSEQIVVLGRDDQNRERLTTKEMLQIESTMLKQASELKARNGYSINSMVREAVTNDKNLSKEQNEAYLHITNSNDITCIIGYAGTGKSHLLAVAREAWEKEGFRVQGIALAGVAVENLQDKAGITSNTAANRLVNWENGRELINSKDVLVIDEAGMLGSRDLAKIIDTAYQAKAKVVLVGDPDQLQAILAGAPFRAIAEQVGYLELTDIRRQKAAWQKEATKHLAQGNIREALYAYDIKGCILDHKTKEDAISSIIEQWTSKRNELPKDSQIILAYTNEDVKALNHAARNTRTDNGELGENHLLNTSKGQQPFAIGDRIYFLKNEKQLNVKNGTLGTIKDIKDKQLIVTIDPRENIKQTEKQRTISFNTEQYNHITHGYAATVHKSQAITVDHSYVLASKYFDRHLAYVSMSRHRKSAELHYVEKEFKNNYTGLVDAMSRDRSKDLSTDYTNFANGRNITTYQEQKEQQAREQQNQQERRQSAEQRLNQRLMANEKWQLMQAVEEYNKRAHAFKATCKLDTLQVNQRGEFCRTITVNNRDFGLLSLANRYENNVGYAIVPFKQVEQLREGEKIIIQKTTDRSDQTNYNVVRDSSSEITHNKQQEAKSVERDRSVEKEHAKQRERVSERQLDREIER